MSHDRPKLSSQRGSDFYKSVIVHDCTSVRTVVCTVRKKWQYRMYCTVHNVQVVLKDSVSSTVQKTYASPVCGILLHDDHHMTKDLQYIVLYTDG